MDSLKACIQYTLDSNAEIRHQAELRLKIAEDQPGFLNALLDILQDPAVDDAVQLSTIVYVKNKVVKGWAPITGDDEISTHKRIPEEERPSFRERLIPLLISSPPKVRTQLIPILTRILQNDFPQKWPQFMDHTAQLLNVDNANGIFAGLLCLLAISRVYRYKPTEARVDFDNIVARVYPHICNIGMRLVQEESPEAGEMLRTVVKTYKNTISGEMPPALMVPEAARDWCQLFLAIIEKKPPANAMPDDLEERELNPWWKSKKWAYDNLLRLFSRYGKPTSITRNDAPGHKHFSKLFISEFAPTILKGFLKEVEKWATGTQWLSRASLTYTINFLEECIQSKTTWACLKPSMDNLISHLIFPVLCQSDEDIELFNDDPQEYVHRKLNVYDESSVTDMAAVNFLITLTKLRKEQTFTILQFINGVVSKYQNAPDDQKSPREKEGALRMIGTLSSVILGKKSPIANQVEYFFELYVFPEFQSPYGYLRARACDTLQKFQQKDFKEENLNFICESVLSLFGDPTLPVRVEAALVLQPLIRHDAIKARVQGHIQHIMTILLQLANEVDVDSLSNVMEEFVEVFSAELSPFAAQLSEQLRDTYIHIVGELLERREQKDDNSYDGLFADFDDKSITALGVLQTVGTLILTLETTPDVLLQLEEILYPVFEVTLNNQLFDLYNEIFEIIDSCTFAAKSISPKMWEVFDLIFNTFTSGSELYLEDLLPVMANYVTYGAPGLAQNPVRLDKIMMMIREKFNDPKAPAFDQICGCRLAECLMLNLRGQIDQYVPELTFMAMKVLSSSNTISKANRLHLMEAIINAIYYNPALAIQILQANKCWNDFLTLWFSNFSLFKRVHDKKLAILAICSLLNIPASGMTQPEWPSSLHEVAMLIRGATQLFQALPAAVKNREEVTAQDSFPFDDDEYEDGSDSGNEWADELEADESGLKNDIDEEDPDVNKYLQQLDQQALKFSGFDDDDEDDETLDEENLLDSPMDKVEPYSVFRSVWSALQAKQAGLDMYLGEVWGPEAPEIKQALHGILTETDSQAATTMAGASPAQQHALG